MCKLSSNSVKKGVKSGQKPPKIGFQLVLVFLLVLALRQVGLSDSPQLNGHILIESQVFLGSAINFELFANP
jgi:hypothetical protein